MSPELKTKARRRCTEHVSFWPLSGSPRGPGAKPEQSDQDHHPPPYLMPDKNKPVTAECSFWSHDIYFSLSCSRQGTGCPDSAADTQHACQHPHHWVLNLQQLICSAFLGAANATHFHHMKLREFDSQKIPNILAVGT